MWGAGDYEPIVEITAEIHEELLARLEPRPGERWLDVATGTGAVARRAARGGAAVTGLDLAPALVEIARRGAAEEGLEVAFDVGDAEALPYEDATFDTVTSAIGVQFAPDHRAVAGELARVCRPGGRLGLAAWTPDGGVADMFRVMRPFMPSPAEGAGNTFDWGRREYVEELLGDTFELEFETLDTPLVAPSAEDVWQRFSTAYGPTKTLVESLEPDRRDELHRAWVELFEAHREGGGIRQSRTYLLGLGTRR